MVGVRKCDSAREPGSYAHCNCYFNADSNPTGFGNGHTHGNSNGGRNFDTDSYSTGYSYDYAFGDASGYCNFDSGFDSAGNGYEYSHGNGN